MKNFKRLLYYLLINLMVSACATFAVLLIWERTHPGAFGALEVPGIALQASPTPEMALATDIPISEPSEASPTPTLALAAYRVQEGDSLGTIAEQFETTVAELVAINGITNPDELGSGQVIYVPAPPISETVATTPSEGTPLPEGVSNPQGASGAKVSGVFGAGDLATERVRLECSGDTDVSLAGWTLSDGDKHTFTFPNLDLFPGGAVDVYSRRGTNDVVSLYWGMEAAVWESGETVILKNAAGEIQSTYKVP